MLVVDLSEEPRQGKISPEEADGVEDDTNDNDCNNMETVFEMLEDDTISGPTVCDSLKSSC